MLTPLLNKPGATDAHYFVIIIVLLLLILALSAWQWATSLPRPVQSLIGWASVVLVVLLASELLPLQEFVLAGRQIGLEALAWMDAHPLVVLLVLPALMFGSIFWRRPV